MLYMPEQFRRLINRIGKKYRDQGVPDIHREKKDDEISKGRNYCQKCGTYSEDGNYCSRCGEKL